MSKLVCPRCGTTFQLDIKGEPKYECPNCKTDILIDRQSILENLAEEIKNKNYSSAREKADELYQMSDSNAVDTFIYALNQLEKNHNEIKKKFRITLLTILLLTVAAFTVVTLVTTFTSAAFAGTTLVISASAYCLAALLIMLRHYISTKKLRAAEKAALNDCNSNISVMIQKVRLTVNG